MRKLRIYLDTSVISHLYAPDTPEKQQDTQILWEAIQAGGFEACISPVVIAEVMNCPEPKRSVLLEKLSEIHCTELPENDEVTKLAAKYLDSGILRKKSSDDCEHIAYASVYHCDMIVSWNFKHIVNLKTISGVKSVNAIAGYMEISIYSPTILISGGAEDDS